MNRMPGIAAPILIALLGGPAVAEDATPNLVGEWSGAADAVVIGSGVYRPGDKTLKDPPYVDQRTFNYSIKGQNGRRFWGEIKSGDRTEPFAAAISLDGKYAHGADTDGNFHILSVEEMELCYAQSADVANNQIVATVLPHQADGQVRVAALLVCMFPASASASPCCAAGPRRHWALRCQAQWQDRSDDPALAQGSP
jgi:hypothetical protein